MRKGFKTGMCVTGSPALLKSLVSEATKLGWDSGLYFGQRDWLRFFKNGSFGYFTTPEDFMEYSLPEDWNEVIAFLASGEDVKREVVTPKVKKVATPKKKVEPVHPMVGKYVKLIGNESGFKDGDIGIIEKKEYDGFLISVPNRTSVSSFEPFVYFSKTFFTMSTKEAYDAQHNPTTKFKVGDYVEIVKNANGGRLQVGAVGIVIEETGYSYTVVIDRDISFYCDYELKLVTKGDWLLSEAKRMYPVGTRFQPAHVTSKSINTIESSSFSIDGSNNIVEVDPDGGSKIGSNSWINCVYFSGKWATIIEDKSTILKFGSTDWILDVKNKTATSEYGTITLKEIETCYYWITKRPSLLGHGISTGDMTNISFGCQRGTFSQLDAIYSTLKG